YFEGTVTGTYEQIGGLAGYAAGSANVPVIEHSYAVADVTGDASVKGGLAGSLETGKVIHSFSGGSVGRGDTSGGFAGNLQMDVTYAYSLSEVEDGPASGGFAGKIESASVNQTYAVGGVPNDGSEEKGIYAGQNNVTIEHSFYNAGIDGTPCGTAGNPCDDLTGLTVAEMVYSAPFELEGWDFTNIWAIDEGESTPYLRQVTGSGLPLAPVSVTAGTAFDDLPLPETVQVRKGHVTQRLYDVTVDWDSSGYDPGKAGTQWVSASLVLDGGLDGYTLIGPSVLKIRVDVAGLDAPAGLTATAGNGEITLSWSAVRGADSYTVYRQVVTSGIASWEAVQDGITATTYTVTGLTNGQSYTFAVTAKKGTVESELSDPVTAVPKAPSGGGGNSGGGSGGGSGG